MSRLGAALALAWLGLGCAAAQVVPRTSASVKVDEADEVAIWRMAGEVQAEIDRSGLLLGDAALDAYLLDLARSLEPAAVLEAIQLRVRVLRHRVPNAFAFPNGAVYVTTGLLALAEDEAQLAFVLAHEAAHAVGRHGLRAQRSAAGTGALLNVLGLPFGAAARPGGLFLDAAMAGYSRDLEREADREALGLAAQAGYDPRRAGPFHLRVAAWCVEQKIPEGASLYASHPRAAERAADAAALATASGWTGGALQQPRFAERTSAALLDLARAEMTAGRYPAATQAAETYAGRRPDDARGPLLLGDIGRRQGGDDGAAVAAYRRALALDPSLAEAWRGLGYLLARQGERASAAEALGRYLALSPAAADRAHVQASLEELSGGGR